MCDTQKPLNICEKCGKKYKSKKWFDKHKTTCVVKNIPDSDTINSSKKNTEQQISQATGTTETKVCAEPKQANTTDTTKNIGNTEACHTNSINKNLKESDDLTISDISDVSVSPDCPDDPDDSDNAYSSSDSNSEDESECEDNSGCDEGNSLLKFKDNFYDNSESYKFACGCIEVDLFSEHFCEYFKTEYKLCEKHAKEFYKVRKNAVEQIERDRIQHRMCGGILCPCGRLVYFNRMNVHCNSKIHIGSLLKTLRTQKKIIGHREHTN